MIHRVTSILVLASVAVAAPAHASSSDGFRSPGVDRSSRELAPYLQCVPYAREVSGIEIYGDAHTWWNQAAGRFQRGNAPKIGAVLAFRPHRNMQLGHVAAVSRIIDNRTVLLRHANWSPINGRRGQVENDVRAIDVSPANDWSSVRVWYAPIKSLGKTAWPTHGFIYSDKAPKHGNAKLRVASAVTPQPTRQKSSRAFLNAFNGFENQGVAKRAPVKMAVQPRRVSKPATPIRAASRDPFAGVIAKYEN